MAEFIPGTLEVAAREQSSITLSRFKDSVAWHIKIAFDGADELDVLERIAKIHRLLKAEYAPDLEAQLAESVAAAAKP